MRGPSASTTSPRRRRAEADPRGSPHRSNSREAERLGGLEVDDELELCRLFDGDGARPALNCVPFTRRAVVDPSSLNRTRPTPTLSEALADTVTVPKTVVVEVFEFRTALLDDPLSAQKKGLGQGDAERSGGLEVDHQL